ncbi:unnamed protein product [Microthlaspi erraticum]|uniref:Uncharacterized protein n=1 Tax=Microthlaspi erraticum TaxID=1685480 RepID=A0A6D2JJA5_9BRAS|nr:unnamed protein product [Microthlaspi erraticum]
MNYFFFHHSLFPARATLFSSSSLRLFCISVVLLMGAADLLRTKFPSSFLMLLEPSPETTKLNSNRRCRFPSPIVRPILLAGELGSSDLDIAVGFFSAGDFPRLAVATTIPTFVGKIVRWAT